MIFIVRVYLWSLPATNLQDVAVAMAAVQGLRSADPVADQVGSQSAAAVSPGVAALKRRLKERKSQ